MSDDVAERILATLQDIFIYLMLRDGVSYVDSCRVAKRAKVRVNQVGKVIAVARRKREGRDARSRAS